MRGDHDVVIPAIIGTGDLTVKGVGTSTLVLSGTNLYSGGTNIRSGAALTVLGGHAIPDSSGVTIDNGGLLFVGANETIGSLSGAGAIRGASAGTTGLTTGANNISTSFSGSIADLGAAKIALTKTGTGNFILSGANTYSGSTTVDGGTLSVNGSIANSTVTVSPGGTLGGGGTVGDTTINGGTLAPGNSIGTLTVQGNLVFTSAATYLVEVSPSSADRTNVTGVATLGGATVRATFAAGTTYVARRYTIINATGGVSGAFGLAATNLPQGFLSSLSYDANNAYLNLTLNFVPSTGPSAPNFGNRLTGNQQGVANALNYFFNTSGGIPLLFGTLTAAGLTQAAGEVGTTAQQTTFNVMSMSASNLLTDPFIDGRGSDVGRRRSTTATLQTTSRPTPRRARLARRARRGCLRCDGAQSAAAAPAPVDLIHTGACGPRVSVERRPPTAMPRRARTPRPAACSAPWPGADYRFSPSLDRRLRARRRRHYFSVANGAMLRARFRMFSRPAYSCVTTSGQPTSAGCWPTLRRT